MQKPRQKLLLVAPDEYSESLVRELSPRYDCFSVQTAEDAIKYLDDNKGKNTAIFVKDGISYTKPKTNVTLTAPEEFKPYLESTQLGWALVEYIRNHGLILSDTPVYLASYSPEKYEHLKGSFAKVLDFGDYAEHGKLLKEMIPINYRTQNDKREIGG